MPVKTPFCPVSWGRGEQAGANCTIANKMVVTSAKVLAVCVSFLVLGLWVGHRQFTAAINVVMAGLAWWLTKSAINIRHPFNPIGSSDSAAFKGFFVAIFFVVLLMAVQLARWLRVDTRKE